MKNYIFMMSLCIPLVACSATNLPKINQLPIQAQNSNSSQYIPNEEGLIAVVMIEEQMFTVWKENQIVPSAGAHRMLGNSRLQNGMNIMMDGTVKMPNGKTVQLHDGDAMMMDGTIKQGSSLQLKLEP